MKQKKIQCKIPLQTIQEGIHEFRFTIEKTFIEQYTIEEVLDAHITVVVTFRKQTQLHHVNYSITGTAVVPCDRCLDDCTVTLDMQDSLVLKIASTDNEFADSEDVYNILSDETEFDISDLIYESIILALPLQKIHPKGMCNKEIEKYIRSEEQKKNTTIDSRWESLQNIFDN